jgi:DNA-binding response OmpR family regulator
MSVLIDDDDPVIRNMLNQIFTKEGYEVVKVSNGKEGLKLNRNHPADLIVTDLVMPEMDGVETIQAVLRESPAVKIIAISGGDRNPPDNYLTLAKYLGDDRTFTKLVECIELVTADMNCCSESDPLLASHGISTL